MDNIQRDNCFRTRLDSIVDRRVLTDMYKIFLPSQVIYKTRLLTIRTHTLRVAYVVPSQSWAITSSRHRAALLHTTSKLYLDTERASHSNPSSSNPPFPPLPRPNSSTSSTSHISPPSVPPPITTPRKRITLVRDLPPQFGRNQIVDVPAQVALELQEVMKGFKAPIRYAFGYGSGVFKQSGYKDDVSLRSTRVCAKKRLILMTLPTVSRTSR